MRFVTLSVVAGFLVLAAVQCSNDSDDESSSSSSSGTGGSGGSGGGAGAGWGNGGLQEVTCQGKLYQCGDTLDNDQDGLTDWADPDCLGPCDNNEAGFVTNIPGGSSTNKCRRDCYFDQDSGTGNDDCMWDLWCDSDEPQALWCAFSDPPPSQADCPDNQSSLCLDVCLPLVPNGCDCFGCCELPAESGNYVYIGSEDDVGPTCSLGDEEDPEKCHPCIPVEDCFDGCGHCELCLGKTELPEDCFDPDGGNDEQCPPEFPPCGLPGQDPCPTDSYCVTGCCRPTPS
jgi:hypothetical protein